MQSSSKQITIASGGHCVERAFSTMRLALGYSSGLPERYPFDISKKPKQVAQLSSLVFPNHRIRYWAEKEHCCGDNVTYMGDTSPANGVFDQCLVAFSYIVDEERSHFVIGTPGGLPLSLIVAVELRDAWDDGDEAVPEPDNEG